MFWQQKVLEVERNEVKIMWAYLGFNYGRDESWLNIFSSSYLSMLSLNVISIIYQRKKKYNNERTIGEKKEWTNKRQNGKITTRPHGLGLNKEEWFYFWSFLQSFGSQEYKWICILLIRYFQDHPRIQQASLTIEIN